MSWKKEYFFVKKMYEFGDELNKQNSKNSNRVIKRYFGNSTSIEKIYELTNKKFDIEKIQSGINNTAEQICIEKPRCQECKLWLKCSFYNKK